MAAAKEQAQSIQDASENVVQTGNDIASSAQDKTLAAIESVKASAKTIEKFIETTREKVKPAAEMSVKILKLIAIALIGMADILILQVVLLILNSKNILLALLFTQFYMVLFFILPAIVIFRYPVPI